MKFLVMSEREILNYNVKDIHIIISIKSPKSFRPIIPYYSNCLEILYLEFHDLDRYYPDREYKLISPLDAKLVWDVVNVYKDKISLIICQCEAGISRSAGVAGAWSKVLNGDDTEIFKKYLPNMLVYNTILNGLAKWGYKVTLSFRDKKDPRKK